METNIKMPKAIALSLFGMPACGHTAALTFGGFGTTFVVRNRQDIAKGDMGLAVAYVPGTSAWRPPSS